MRPPVITPGLSSRLPEPGAWLEAYELFSALPYTLRAVALGLVQGMTQQEIAAWLRTDQGTLCRWIRKIRQELRIKMTP